MPSRVTIVDLAHDLGISKTTVADALAGSGRVAEQTRVRVQEAARARGYVSNRAAQNLRRQSTGAVGLYIPPVVRAVSFYMDFALGGAERAAVDGFDLTLFARSGNHERRFAVDGAVAVDPLPGDPFVAQLLAARMPVVTAGRTTDPAREHAVIEIPHREMATSLFEHLAGNGARRIAFISPDVDFPSSWATDLVQAYEQWCATTGQQPAHIRLTVYPDEREFRAAVAELAGLPGVDALAIASEGLAARAKRFLAETGVTVGAGFQLASLSGDPATEQSDPDIACLDLQPRTFGEEAFGFLLDVIGGAADQDAYRNHEARLVPAADADE